MNNINQFKIKNRISSSEERRRILLNSMEKDSSKGFNCFSCVGHCCTFISNSMKISSLEALDIIEDLIDKNLFNEETYKALKNNIIDYRLDRFLHLKLGLEMRRTYTCPFFKGKSLGCTISKTHKPYGCLGFNPDKKDVSEWGNCSSRQKLLKEREKFSAEEKEENERLNNLIDIKEIENLPIPVAVLKVWNYLDSIFKI